MSAVMRQSEAHFMPLTADRIDTVLAIENRAYDHPWSRGNFADSLRAGYEAQMLMGDDTLIGYYVAMKGVDEVHLLNVTVAPEFQRQGWGQVLLDALAIWSRGQGAEWLWLELRVSNTRALSVYEANGYRRVGERKAYYPAGGGTREDAIVMSLRLT